MGERKVINKYFPPDFDPAKIPRTKKKDLNPNFVVRMMLPMSVRCMTCGEYMYRGKKFNSRKEDVDGPEGEYLGIKIFRFYFKCVTCSAEFTIKTDPKNMDYEVEGGVSRNFEPHKDNAEQKERQLKEREESEKDDAMSKLENKTKDSKIEMDILDALDEIKTQNSRNAKIDVEGVIEARRLQAAEQAANAAATAGQLDEDEELEVQRAFAAGRVKRLREDEEEEEGSSHGSCSQAIDTLTPEGGALFAVEASRKTSISGKIVPKKPKLPILAIQSKAKSTTPVTSTSASTSVSAEPAIDPPSSTTSATVSSLGNGADVGGEGSNNGCGGGLLGLVAYGSSSGSSSPAENG